MQDYHDDIRQEQMWEMQALTSTPTQSQSGDQHSPNCGGVTDMDTSNDEKSDLDTIGMDCSVGDKNENFREAATNNEQHQQHPHLHQHQQSQQQHQHLISHQSHTTTTTNGVTALATSGGIDSLSAQSNAATSKFFLIKNFTKILFSNPIKRVIGLKSGVDKSRKQTSK